MKWKTLSEYPCNYEKKRAAVWKFKIERVSFMNSNTTAKRCYQQPQLEIMLRRTHTQKKKRLSKMNNKNVCWLTLSFTFSCAIVIYLLQSTCCRRAGMCIDWWIFAMPYSFSCIFSSYLTLAHHSIYIFMLTTSPCWWIFLNVFINELLLATTTGKQCSTILLLTWTNMLPTWHFLYY